MQATFLLLLLLPHQIISLPEMYTSTFKRTNCVGKPLTEKTTESCSSSPNQRGLYVKTVCSGEKRFGGSTPTITTTGYLTKSCRGTPQTHEIGNAGCTNGKDNKGSTLKECVIPEVYEPSSSNLACCKTCPDETRVPCAGSTMYLNQIVAVISIVLIALQIL